MYEEIKNKLKEVKRQLSEPNIINDRQKMIKLSQKQAELKPTVVLINELEKDIKNLEENREIIEHEQDQELKNLAQEEIDNLEKEVSKLKEDIKIALRPQDPNDKKNTIVEIRAGAGGDEAALFVGDLFRMYSHYCEQQGWKLEIITSNEIGIGGFKEIIFLVNGLGSYGKLKYEAGTHRVQRVPETEKQGRVHTSAATVVVLPEAEEVDINIDPNDVRVDTFCSSGPGGQSVNTTYSAIRLTHIPSGLVVSCQDQKSQHQNKDKAMQVLRSRLLAKQEEEKQKEDSSTRKKQVGAGNRGDKIRTYNFPQDRVTDHRISVSWHNIDKIMNGEIDNIINELKKNE